jgi:hypothetical protein
VPDSRTSTIEITFHLLTSSKGVQIDRGLRFAKKEWHEIAAEAMNETDPKKRMQLEEELERALEERDKKRREKA